MSEKVGSGAEASGRDPLTAKLLELLYSSRKAKGLTVRELARQAEISPSYVSLIENGHKVPDVGTIERIGKVLDIDADLLRAWATVRGKTADATESVEAARSLALHMDVPMGRRPGIVAQDLAFYEMEPPPDYRSASLPDAHDHAIAIPLMEEGEEPGATAPSSRRPLWVDERALPERTELTGAFAWRVGTPSLERLRGVYRRGDFVVISPRAWRARMDTFNPRKVFAVRLPERVVLSRVAWTGEELVLLGGENVIVLESAGPAALKRLIAGRVIAAVQRFR